MNSLQSSLIRFFYSYKRLGRHVIRLIMAAWFLHMINSVFFLILNIYLSKQGYPDHEIADFISYRFLTVMLLAFPLGFIIRGRRLKPFFYIAAILVPASSVTLITAIPYEINWIIYGSMIIWGMAFTCMQVTILPYILRNARQSTHSEAIALNYASWSISMVITGFVVAVLSNFAPEIFSEQVLLTLFGVLGFFSIYLIFSIRRQEIVPEKEHKTYDLSFYDWPLIFRALIPTLIISVGAGMTIPFINLFFFHVYNIDSNQFAIMGMSTAILVAIASIIVPTVKRRFGYIFAITVTQGSAVLLLILLASTELYSHLSIAVFIAIGCYILRQPLMNMAMPMTSELTMYYVGQKNQEIISALTSTIWSGSWFISSQLFRIFRGMEWDFSSIFFLTSGIYAVGVVLYYLLVKDYYKRRNSGLL